MSYRVQVYAGDVGGLDLDFEAETLEEARQVARDEHAAGSRPAEIYDEDDERLVEEYVPATERNL